MIIQQVKRQRTCSERGKAVFQWWWKQIIFSKLRSRKSCCMIILLHILCLVFLYQIIFFIMDEIIESTLSFTLLFLSTSTSPSSLVAENRLSLYRPIMEDNNHNNHHHRFSPVVFVCCERLYGEEGNYGQLSRSLSKNVQESFGINVLYMNAPCFSINEHEQGNPKEHYGKNWPIYKQFPNNDDRVELFQQRIQEIYHHGGMVLAEGNCKVPQAELSNVWLEALLRYNNTTTTTTTKNSSSNNNNNEEEEDAIDIKDTTTTTTTTTTLSNIPSVTPYILDRFLLQDKHHLIRILTKYGYQDYVPKHYNISSLSLSSSSSSSSIEISIPKDEYPVVLKREKSEGGVGVYIVHSQQELIQKMKEDERYENMGMRHKKSRHRMLGTGWVIEEFLPGATQELIVYIRPRGTRNGQTYFWCGSHSNPRWHDDGNFVKGYADFRGTVTTPTECRSDLLQLMSTVMEKEDIYGTGCINYKYGKVTTTTTITTTNGNEQQKQDQQQEQQYFKQPKIHDWNLRTCATMSNWNNGKVFLDLINQIPRRVGSQQLALFEEE